MASSLYFVVLLCLTGGLWTGANAQGKDQSVNPDEDGDCCVSCPPGWTQFENNCYIFYFSAKDWADAEVACIAVGGNLAPVHNKEQLTFIEEMIKRSTGSEVPSWLGGHDAVKEGVWLWSDGSKFDYKFWSAGEPSNGGGAENCMVNAFSGKANDLNCQNKKSYVCGKSLY
ncbi:galactose-specific lectin nattectin-like [Anabas testudineus]|uniref:C-type lectin domain-containing protein n=1 Tax=Anabas testudineus TaxID=64144 RepID=A0A3Q1HK34_ANATE|nr:galactose-specific lectin nattectin-like [Anabas testudineus]